MKRNCVFLISMMFLVSCEVQQVAIRGNYDKVYEFTTSKSTDAVWSDIIDLFAQKGIPIEVIDKSSGFISSKTMSFLSYYTFEDNNGQLMDQNSWIVLDKNIDPNLWQPNVKPQNLTASWNVRIKKLESGTKININLLNIIGSTDISDRYGSKHYNFSGKSTGVFESWIFGMIK